MIGEGMVDGNRVVFDNLQQFSGAQFGTDFDPEDVMAMDWGSLEIQFEGEDCNSATLIYAGPVDFGEDSRSLSRLTEIVDAPCGSSETRRFDKRRDSVSGAWRDPTHDGEGWFLEELDGDRVNLYWFTYDESGNAAWMTGVGSRTGDRVQVDELWLATGATFGSLFEPEDVRLEYWGSVNLQFQDCDRATLEYASVLPGYGSGTLEPERIARPEGVSCWEQEVDVKTVVRGNTAFSLGLYQTLKNDPGDLFFSPFSISTALAMTYAGARGNTATQMADTLHFELDDEFLHPAYAQLQGRLNTDGEGGYELNVANALWGQAGFPFLSAFVELLNSSYGAGLNQVDFSGATEQARSTINRWVEEQTLGKIPELLTPGVVSALTRLVLTNAIYFKGDWQFKFDSEDTQQAPFTRSDGSSVTVPMMYQTGEHHFADTADLKILELPYDGEDVSMLLLLPRQPEGLAQLEQDLTESNLQRWLALVEEPFDFNVEVYLPRFQLRSEFSLSEQLIALGMTDAFGTADFSGINGGHDLSLSFVVHQAFVDVNEEGTEAAAATAVGANFTPSPPPPTFRADHPFLFLILDKRSDSILFVGRVSELGS